MSNHLVIIRTYGKNVETTSKRDGVGVMPLDVLNIIYAVNVVTNQYLMKNNNQSICHPLETAELETSLENNLDEIEEHIENQIKAIKHEIDKTDASQQNMDTLKNRLIFIENLCNRKTCFETEVETRLARLNNNQDVLKNNLVLVIQELQTLKKQVELLLLVQSQKRRCPFFCC